MEPDGSAQVAVFVDFENLVLGAVKELPDQANPAPYEALTRLCRGYGNASVRRAYADWANTRFGSHQEDLAMNGVDLRSPGSASRTRTPPTSGWPSTPWRP